MEYEIKKKIHITCPHCEKAIETEIEIELEIEEKKKKEKKKQIESNGLEKECCSAGHAALRVSPPVTRLTVYGRFKIGMLA